MKKLRLVQILIVFLFLLAPVSIRAASPSPSPTTEVNSFELFWPLAPGKTMADALYPLKALKENIRGFFIFGLPQKADYETFLATKRIIEAEKLLKEGKTDLAEKTVDVFTKKLDVIITSWGKVRQSGDIPVSIKDNLRKQLENIRVFLVYLSAKYDGNIKGKLDRGLEKVDKLLNSL